MEIKPGYFNKKPMLREINSMRKIVGLQDSCLQTNEVAILYLEENLKQSSNTEMFMVDLFRRYSISSGIGDFGYFKSNSCKLYILQTYNTVEPFFKLINKTYQFYNNFTGEWKVKDENGKMLDPFNQLLVNMPPEKSREIKKYPECALLNYYRLVRNSTAHLQYEIDGYKKVRKYYSDNIMGNLNYFKDNYRIDAPNSPEDIVFKDFILYTRALKYFSNIINDICFPTIESLVKVAINDSDLQKKLLQVKGLKSEERLLRRINIIRGFFRYHFNTAYKELCDEFCKAYLDYEGIDCSRYLR